MKINKLIKKLGHIKESLIECQKETNNQVVYDLDHQVTRIDRLIDDIDSFGVDDCDCGDGKGVLNEHCDCENENGIPNYVDDVCDDPGCNNKLNAEQIGSDEWLSGIVSSQKAYAAELQPLKGSLSRYNSRLLSLAHQQGYQGGFDRGTWT